ncbi:MAG TPA: hypothetical protein VIN07_13260, partial [Flavipsychrobacter sp.]
TLVEYPYKTGGNKPVIDDENPSTHAYNYTTAGVLESELIARFENGKMAEKQYYLIKADANGIPVSGKFSDNNNNQTHYTKYIRNSDTSYAYNIYTTDHKMEGQISITKNRTGRIENEAVFTITGGAYDVYVSRTLRYNGNIIEKEKINTYHSYQDKSHKLKKSETYYYYNEKLDKHGNPVNYIVRNEDMEPVKYIDCVYEYFE